MPQITLTDRQLAIVSHLVSAMHNDSFTQSVAVDGLYVKTSEFEAIEETLKPTPEPEPAKYRLNPDAVWPFR